MTKIQQQIYRDLLRPGCYLRELIGGKFELVGSGRRCLGIAADPIIEAKTVACLKRDGHIVHEKRDYFGVRYAGYFAVLPPGWFGT